jgi:hypothetical protein
MPDLAERIETMYQRDRLWAWVIVVALWVATLSVLFLAWPHIPDQTVRMVALFGASAVLIFNTASIMAMLSHYHEDKEFIYGLDIRGLDAMKEHRTHE